MSDEAAVDALLDRRRDGVGDHLGVGAGVDRGDAHGGRRDLRVLLHGQALERDEQVKLSGFGVFQVRAKRARMGRNPKTGEPAEIEPRRVIGFRASQVMKARIDRALEG